MKKINPMQNNMRREVQLLPWIDLDSSRNFRTREKIFQNFRKIFPVLGFTKFQDFKKCQNFSIFEMKNFIFLTTQRDFHQSIITYLIDRLPPNKATRASA